METDQRVRLLDHCWHGRDSRFRILSPKNHIIDLELSSAYFKYVAFICSEYYLKLYGIQYDTASYTMARIGTFGFFPHQTIIIGLRLHYLRLNMVCFIKQVQQEGKVNVSMTSSSPLSDRATSLWSRYS